MLTNSHSWLTAFGALNLGIQSQACKPAPCTGCAGKLAFAASRHRRPRKFSRTCRKPPKQGPEQSANVLATLRTLHTSDVFPMHFAWTTAAPDWSPAVLRHLSE